MKADVYSLEGKVVKSLELPKAFSETYRKELVKRAVLSDETKEYQPKGSYKYAGTETSAKYRGRKETYGAIRDMGISILPREVLPGGRFGRVRRVPGSVGGRRAHPPKPHKKIIEKINKKEYKKALRCAISATGNTELVAERNGFKPDVSLPIVVEDSFEKLKKTKDIMKFLDALKLSKFLKETKKKNKKSILVVVGGGDVLKAASNIAGADVVKAEELKVKHLAPGTHGGRITLFTESALKKLGEAS